MSWEDYVAGSNPVVPTLRIQVLDRNPSLSIILGKKSFYDIDFLVNNRVLTPRFETEILVEEIIKYYKFSSKINILDIGLSNWESK